MVKHNTNSGVSLNEFISFLRLKICFFITGIGVTGYLLFNPVNLKLVYVSLSVFFITASVYCYNLITDKKEDLLNHKKLNLYVENGLGVYFVYLFALIGLIISSKISLYSLYFYILLILTGAAYSYYRIKNIFPFKNIYTGFIITLVFFVGSCAYNLLTSRMLVYYFALSLHIFTISLISDLRDYSGDSKAGLRTLPVIIGYNSSKYVVYLMLLIFTSLTLAFRLYGLLPLIPFIMPIWILLHLDRPRNSHVTEMYSFMYLPIALILSL